MDADRLDRMVRSVTITASRRMTVAGLLGTLLGGLLGRDPLGARAKGKQGKKGKGKKKRGPVSPPPLTCGSGTKVCNDQCVALSVCCGGCLNGAVCQNGACVSCGAGLTACNGVCVNLLTDEAHCGACGNACPAGEICYNGFFCDIDRG